MCATGALATIPGSLCRAARPALYNVEGAPPAAIGSLYSGTSPYQNFAAAQLWIVPCAVGAATGYLLGILPGLLSVKPVLQDRLPAKQSFYRYVLILFSMNAVACLGEWHQNAVVSTLWQMIAASIWACKPHCLPPYRGHIARLWSCWRLLHLRRAQLPVLCIVSSGKDHCHYAAVAEFAPKVLAKLSPMNI